MNRDLVNRCSWARENDPLMVKYHDEEYGVKRFGLKPYFEKLCLESFQAGLSWRTILHKREAFRKAFYEFDPYIVKNIGQEEVFALMHNKDIVRNKRKIEAVIKNACLVVEIEEDIGFENYINSFDDGKMLAVELKKKGFSFIGETICCEYLTSIGALRVPHEENCFMFRP